MNVIIIITIIIILIIIIIISSSSSSIIIITINLQLMDPEPGPRPRLSAASNGRRWAAGPRAGSVHTPNLPANIIPINIAWLKLFRELPYGPGNSTPLSWDYVWVNQTHSVSRGAGPMGGSKFFV